MASNSQTFTVVGFQYEPVRSDKSQPQVDIYDDDDDKDDDTTYTDQGSFPCADTDNNRTATNLQMVKYCQCKPSTKWVPNLFFVHGIIRSYH